MSLHRCYKPQADLMLSIGFGYRICSLHFKTNVVLSLLLNPTQQYMDTQTCVYVTKRGSRNGHQKETCLEEIMPEVC